jgi:glycosyltransferase involved in cell wall biosynthesis
MPPVGFGFGVPIFPGTRAIHRSENVITDLAVIVPAADEQEHIGECLEAISAACQQLWAHPCGQTVRIQVIVVLDACHDATADIVASHPDVVSVNTCARNVGAARRVGTECALGHIRTATCAWLAHSDADSVVPENWLVGMLDAAEAGFDLVLGTVRPGPGLPLRSEQAWLDKHPLREGHQYVHGANLGIRASRYIEVGGWRPCRSGEDVDLARRVEESGAGIRRTSAIPVMTSSRMHGRAPYGFSSYLRELTDTL